MRRDEIERVFVLKRTELFGDLPSRLLAGFAPHLEEIFVGEGETIFRKGEIGKALFVVIDGAIRIHEGEEVSRILGPDEAFGEITVLTSEVRRATATAIEESRLLRLDQDVLYEVMAGRPAVSKGIIKALVARLK